MYVKDKVIVMSGSWENAHRRYALAHAIGEDVLRAGPAAVRWRQAEIDETYGGLDQALRDIQYRWYHALHTAVDGALEDGRPTGDVWRATVKNHRSYRAVLDAFAEHPALAEGEEYHQNRLLAVGISEPQKESPSCPRRKLLHRARNVVHFPETA